ncbi:hypothetical protein PIB30_097117 [Stylosanthes scabra]|uniref:Uncharacterized protein n=1 Tax=Stylosanthes scabra TaxID=79078 RepID=A0ABU6UYN9_9FABA|nr:hypothetical protein [Stylosanthes scabra]
MSEASKEEAGQLHRSKKKLRNNENGGYGGKTSRVVREEDWMLDKTKFSGANGRPRTYADLVMHGTAEPEAFSDDSSDEDESTDEAYAEEDAEDRMDELSMTQFQRETIHRVRKEERSIPSISAKRLEDGTINVSVNRAAKRRLEKPW